VKRQAKSALSQWIRSSQGLDLDPDALFDCHVKRIHEYKRQLLNALHAIALYQRIHEGGDDGVPRVVIFAGKAAPGYAMAKLIIKLIHAVGQMVNGDPATRGRLRVVFLPNYSVSLAERIFPACELSEQISTAGTEASGTGNMKAALNGALTLGTLDGANVEIRDEVGAENMFIFGHTATEIGALRASGYDPGTWVERSAELGRVVDAIARGPLDKAHPDLFRPIVEELLGSDRYFLCAEFDAYVECQRRAAATYRRAQDWARMSVLNVAGMGRFSSDRTLREYAADIWSAAPVRVELEDASGGLGTRTKPRAR
jgi:starch phosphorylase